ncbi:transglycosylase family protein [Streptomyces cellostaticus]|uniref:transglycosylase family protein n=1 Tax=Streptomyces cellostaticus TaxID=67285 RepID=UPI002027022D|nr:transglycosylase family protein [Streptomyces cellostaticus]
MLSGNGRHRRPRQAPALLVAAGVTGSAIAIPLLGAASANAADGTTWDKVADCESGGSWSADTGNGYYGGLQISQDDWHAYGGTKYAATADQASRSQQISVAEKILADKGTTPWATCALLSGLTSDSGSLDVDTGVDTGVGGSGKSDSGKGRSGGAGGSTQSSGSTDESDSSDLPDSTSPSEPAPDPAGEPSPDTGESAGSEGAGKGADKGVETPKSDKSASPRTEGPRGGGSATPDPVVEESDNSWQSAGSWNLVDTGALSSGGRHRGDSADESVTSGQNALSSGRHASPGADTYTVREGDTLASIADSLDVDGGWHGLYARNEKVVGTDPNHISAGQTLEVGSETGQKQR